MTNHKILLLSVLLLLAPAVYAAAESGAVPAAPPTAGSEGDLEPEVTIIHRGGEMIEEYRINGQLYMIKVTPRKGIPYFLVDTDGDGNFEVRQNELDQELLIPQWTILRW
ncbi:MAG: DUF2782 domain-containing protein [Gammaproteobacteria bacterium]